VSALGLPDDTEPTDARPGSGRRANVIGTGLIGGSIGLALRALGWHVTADDRDAGRAERAVALGASDAIGLDRDAEITFVATPVGSIPALVKEALSATTGLVTDAGSVKTPMLPLMDDPRYVGGHPMAGSEAEGIEGARGDLFEGATWVLTPTAGTDNAAFADVRAIVSSFGAEPIALPPELHDQMVAVVSHVPHLTAATLMRLADERSHEQRAVLRLAAGGFRDMTRIAAGHPGIWPDICAENREAIVAELGALIDALDEMREVIGAGDRDALVRSLEQARAARVALPARVQRPEDLAELRIPIPDRKGELARILTLASELDVSVADIEIAHSSEGPQGVLIVLVELGVAGRFYDGLVGLDYRPSLRTLG
jgi:prephenate dehydrogenase